MFNEIAWVVGRKEYRCEWCGEKILCGEKHAHFVGKWEGEFQNWRMHDECHVASTCEDLQDGFSPYEYKRGSGEPK